MSNLKSIHKKFINEIVLTSCVSSLVYHLAFLWLSCHSLFIIIITTFRLISQPIQMASYVGLIILGIHLYTLPNRLISLKEYVSQNVPQLLT